MNPILALNFVTLASLAPGARAQGVKLNAPLARPIGGDIRQAEIDPSGDYLVYVADQEEDEVFDLYALKLAATQPVPVRLNVSRPHADVEGFSISPDGQRVVYRADADVDRVFELHSVPLDGSAEPVVLSGALVRPGVQDFEIALDSRFVVFRGNPRSGVTELYRAPLAGGAAPVTLNGTLVNNGDVLRAGISPRGDRVVYVATQDHATSPELYSVPSDGSAAPVLLSSTLAGTRPHVDEDFRIGSDGARVFYRADEGGGRHDLFSVSIRGGEFPARLNRGETADEGVAHDFEVGPGAQRVVYRAAERTPGEIELFSTRADGRSEPVSLSAGASDVLAFRIAAAGGRVIFDVSSSTSVGLYSASVHGRGTPVLLSAPGELVLVNQGFGLLPGALISPDGSRVVYRAGNELFSIPIDGSLPRVGLFGPNPGIGAPQFGFTADGKRVLYVADALQRNVFELFGVPVMGGEAPVLLSPPLLPWSDVERAGGFTSGNPVVLDPASRFAVYFTDLVEDGAYELFRTRLEAPDATKLHPTLASGPVQGDVVETAFTPDGRFALYRADQDEDETFELYSVSVRPGSRPVRLNAPLPPAADVAAGFRAGSTRVVYLADQEVAGVVELFSVPPDGSLPPLRLSAALAASGDVTHFQLSQDGGTVFYLAEPSTLAQHGIFVVPVDGSAAPVRLSRPLPAGSRIATPAGIHGLPPLIVSANGNRLLYGEVNTSSMTSLLGAPSDGSAPAVELGGTLDVGRSALTPDGSRAVFQAYAGGVGELYTAPADGSGAPTRLNAPLVAGGDVIAFELSPDGRRVAYRADQTVDGQIHLFGAPADGSAPPLQLSVGINVGLARFTPDGLRIVYVVSPAVSTRELHSVAADGSAAPVPLASNVAYGFELSPNSSRVVFSASSPSGQTRLFVVPTLGGLAPVEISPPHGAYPFPVLSSDSRRAVYLTFAGGEERFYESQLVGAPRPRPVSGGFAMTTAIDILAGAKLAPGSDRFLFIADQESDLVYELFQSPLGRLARVPGVPEPVR